MNRLLRRTLVAVISATTLCAAFRLGAAVFNIADGDVTGLKNAIATSASNNQNDTINLAANGTYTLTSVDNAPVGYGANGLPIITYDNGHSLVINGNNSALVRSNGPSFRILICDNQGVDSPAGLTINNLRISNGFAAITESGHGNDGAGILNLGMPLTLMNCTLSGNYANFGAGLATYDAQVTIRNCTIDANLAEDAGGGVYNDRNLDGSIDSVAFFNSTLSRNETHGPYGAGVFSENSANNSYFCLCFINLLHD